MKEVLSQQRSTAQRLSTVESKERPCISLPYAQRSLNPFPFASSGGVPGDFAQSREVLIRSFNATVLIQATNNAGNFWIVRIADSAGNVLARFDTNAPVATPGVFTRFSALPTAQPAASNAIITMTATASGTPGGIFIVPEVLVLV